MNISYTDTFHLDIYNLSQNLLGGCSSYGKAVADKNINANKTCEIVTKAFQDIHNTCGTQISTSVKIHYNRQDSMFRKSLCVVTRLHPVILLRYVVASS
jgi:hypothetical protein